VDTPLDSSINQSIINMGTQATNRKLCVRVGIIFFAIFYSREGCGADRSWGGVWNLVASSYIKNIQGVHLREKSWVQARSGFMSRVV